MKKILLVISVLFTSQSFAAEPVFCSTQQMTKQDGCISTCDAIAAAGGYTLSDFPQNEYRACEGKTTTKQYKVYKIELGKLEVGNESRCTIWEGDDILINDSSTVGTSIHSKYPINLDSCTKGVEYNAFYVTTESFEQFASESVFPDGSGKVVRTTSTYSGKDTGNNRDSVAVWRDTNLSDTTKYYTKPSTSGVGDVYKKLGESSSSVDLSTQSNQLMQWDLLKEADTWQDDTSVRSNFVCSTGDSNDCHQEYSNQTDRYTIIMYTSGDVVGFPLTLKESDKTLNIEWSRFASVRGANQYSGTEFLWYNNSGTLEYVGVRTSGESGYLEISNVRPSTTE